MNTPQMNVNPLNMIPVNMESMNIPISPIQTNDILTMNMNMYPTNVVDAQTRYVDALYALYNVTHIFPTDHDFLSQINNFPPLYKVLYWLKLEHLYPRFVEEEMDLEAIRLMQPNDFVYFNVDRSELFIQFVQWLQ
jgi:hypothetical protein